MPADAELTPSSVASIASVGISAEDQKVLDDALNQVAFNSGSATLTAQSRTVLGQVTALMYKYPQAILEISGHTDSVGSAALNMQLSVRRAQATASFIAGQGVDIQRLRAFGYGESKPLTSNGSPQGRRINRRVEFKLLQPE